MTVWHWWLALTNQQHGPLGFLFSVQGRWYGLTSSVGLQFMFAWWRHRNCHERWCWRIGHHPDPLSPTFKRCTRHHGKAGHGPG